MKLQFKINILSTLLTLIIFICSFTGIYFVYQYLAYHTEFEQLQTQGDEMLVAISELEDTQNIKAVLRSYIPPNGLIHVVDENDKTLIRLQATTDTKKINYKVDEEEHYTISTWEGMPVMAITYPIIWPTHEVVHVQFVQPLTELKDHLVLLRWILILMTLLAIIPIYLASQAIVKITATPIEKLTNTMRRNAMQARYDKHEMNNRSKDEIAQMTETYNSLMEKLEESYTKQQQFVGNASHELKTPLTVIESYAKMLQRRGFENEEVNVEALQAITTQTEHMKSMMAQMLQLARANEGIQMKWEPVAITPVITQIATSIKQAYGRDIHIHGNDFSIISDRDKLTQLLFILLDNARKYSDGPIDVTITNGDHVKIAVQDYGIGISEAEIEHIFDRFYRVAKDRSRETGGTGLGLSIAKTFATALRGEISVKSTLGVGSTFTVTLPKEGPHES